MRKAKKGKDAFWVYLLRCADESIYTGMAKDVESRFKRHKAGAGAKYTRMRGVQEIIYSERHATIGAALKREAAIKKWPRKRKLALIKKSKS